MVGPNRKPGVWRWSIVALLAIIAACLLIEIGTGGSRASAQATPTAAASQAGVFAVAGQVTSDTYGVYLVDTNNGTICVYQYIPNTRRLRLMAARTFVYDRQLDEYNTEPSPKEIRSLVDQQRRLQNATTQP